MKKFLSTALALGVVVGLAATASALELKVTGSYVVDGYYLDQGNGAAAGGGIWPFAEPTTLGQYFVYALGYNGYSTKTEADSWYEHTFRMNPDLIINDKVMMKSEIRFIDRDTIWGTQDDSGRTAVQDGANFSVEKAWMVWDSPAGKVQVGRMPVGAWMGAFVNNGTNGDRIRLDMPAMEGFKAYVFTEKQVEQDAYWADLEDNDKEYYELAGGYEVEGVKAWLGLGWQQDNTKDDATFGFGQYDQSLYRFKGFGDVAINEMFSVTGEFDYKWGERDYATVLSEDPELSGLAAIISAIGKFDALTASLHYAYLSGENDTDSDIEAYDPANGTGWDFEPLYILTGNSTNILNGYRGPNLVGSAVRTAGAHAVVALADYAASEDLTLHGGIGWGKADETTAGVDDDYGWEFDLGMAYKLYDNLTYELHFGWWAVGDFAELGGVMETEDVLLLSHHLSMKF